MDPKKTEANKPTQLFTIIREMNGDEPDIALPDSVDIKELRQILGDDLEFVTLPIGEVNAESRNGNIFTKTSIEELVRQVNDKHPEGMWGHYNDWEISYKYDPPAVRWLAAILDDETGIAWGKLVPLTEEAKRHFKIIRATKSKAGSSIFGTQVARNDAGEIVYFNLITIDISNAERVGVPATAAPPQLSREIHSGQENSEVDPKKNEQPSTDAELKEQVRVLSEENGELKDSIRETRKSHSALLEIKALFEIADNEDVVEFIQRFIDQHEAIAKENRTLLASTIVAEVEAKVAIESSRPVIVSLVQALKPATKKDVDKAVETVLNRDEIKTLLKAQVVEESGGVVNGDPTKETGKNGWQKFVDLPEEDDDKE